MSIYKLHGDSTGGTENALASLDIQFTGEITAILMAAQVVLDADSESWRGEVSFLSTNTIDSNDARGSLAMVTAGQVELTTSGVFLGQANLSISGLNIPVTAGERVFCHSVASAGVTADFDIYLYVDDRADSRLRRRR